MKNKRIDSFQEELGEYFENSIGTTFEKLCNFPKFIPRQHLTTFLAKYELFKKILDVEGAIIEGGVYSGGGLMTWSQLSSIFEPINYTRKIIGFDTFSGFPGMSSQDKKAKSKDAHKGGLALNSFEDLQKSIQLYDHNRFINDIPKVELVKGDVTKTIPKFLKENPHTVISLLYLDFDIYKPTKIALEHFVERIPKGGIVAFDEFNNKNWVGETVAVLETLGIRNLKLKRFPFNSYLTYAILE